MPEIIFNKKVQSEFPIYSDTPYTAIHAFYKMIDLFKLYEIVDLDSSIIKVANRLLSKDIRPIIVSSVNEKKWLELIKKWGLEIGLEEFTKVMSDNRIYKKFPCEIVDTKKPEAKKILSDILSKYDSEYNKVIRRMSS